MKKITSFFAVAMIFLITGCTPIFTSVYSPNLNDEKTAGVGDIFFSHTEGSGYAGGTDPYLNNPFQYDLTIAELTTQKIGFIYNEYTRIDQPVVSSNPYQPIYKKKSDWLIKEGFTKKFDYEVANKTVRFKDFEFEIVSVDKGVIKYRRIK